MITKNSKLKLIKPMGLLNNIGEIYDILDISEKGNITFRCGTYLLGCMSYDEMNEYFEIVEPEKSKRVWTGWLSSKIYYRDLSGKERIITVWYRHNKKRFQVKTYTYNLMAESSCHTEDEFDTSVGFKLATMRLKVKILAKEVEEYAKEI